MKNFRLVALVSVTLVTVFLAISCQGKPASASSTTEASYAFGVLIGTNLKTTGIVLDYEAMTNGLRDTLEKNAPKVTFEAASATFQAAITAALQVKSTENIAKEKAFLESNAKKAGVKTTASGLQYEVIKEGTGVRPMVSDTVKVHYVGTLVDGTKFDSSIDRNEPAVFPLTSVIAGWTEGLQLMTVGSQYKFTIPSALAYGEQGSSDKIPGNTTLLFTVDLLSVEK